MNKQDAKKYKDKLNNNIVQAQKARVIERNKRLLVALEAFRKFGVMSKAATEGGLTRRTITDAISKYPKFAKEWELAYEDYLDDLEHIADQRARSYSDGLLKFLLTAGRKEKYGTTSLTQNNTTINNNQEININPINIVQIAEVMASKIDSTRLIERRKTPTAEEIAIQKLGDNN